MYINQLSYDNRQLRNSFQTIILKKWLINELETSWAHLP